MRAAAVILVLAGCARDPAEAVCPPLDAGDLVVTEVRGDQNPADPFGPWIELFNASGAPIDLLGVKVRFRKLDGASEVPILVRRTVSVVAAGYVVLGRVDDAAPPPRIDYGFALDFHDDPFPGAAAVDVEACGVLIDRARYDSLPRTGTYSLGGTPDADANDLPARWCTNPSSMGTPQAPNIPCS